jgi:hypothetical protein
MAASGCMLLVEWQQRYCVWRSSQQQLAAHSRHAHTAVAQLWWAMAVSSETLYML